MISTWFHKRCVGCRLSDIFLDISFPPLTTPTASGPHLSPSCSPPFSPRLHLHL
ncbi:hypothetical protein BD779DRAFT_1569333 [Infundibulicybe gibba]|nr:hypothetical protein BD779DRAFT_1569333 [Infundibulicybe gibba]